MARKLAALLLIAMSAAVVCPGRAQQQEAPPHHTAEGFRNFPVTPEPPSLGFAFYWRRLLASFDTPKVPPDHSLSELEAVANLRDLRYQDSITWIGQSTLLLKIGGTVILTDPYFAKRASPVMFGPERFVGPGIGADRIPPVNVMILSHNHYDHLDEDFIESVPDKEAVHVLVPQRLGAFFRERGYTRIHELDWWESRTIGELRFTALPMVHYSGRGLGDADRTLWCSWAITGPYGKYFFAGDTAYSDSVFRRIGAAFGRFDLAMIPIGTYGNRKYGVNNHLDPDEAVQVGKELNTDVMVGIHWGTIDLSEEDPWEPPQRFRAAGKERGFLPEQIWILKIGESRRLPGRDP